MLSALETLLPELQLEVLNFIHRPSDLKTLCIASKSLSAITTPVLYYDVQIYLDDISLPFGKGFLLRKNRGRQHVRHLTFFPSALDKNTEDLRLVTRTITLMPVDRLLRLS